MRKSFIYSLILSLLVISSQALADVVSLDSNFVAGQSDMITKLNNDRTALTNGVNNIKGVYAGSVQSSGQIKADTIGEENMADDANPRLRTSEGASCSDLIYTGMLPTTSASLVGSVPAGTAYPDGYRVNKTSPTAKTFTASKWTYVYVLTSGSFDYQETAIGAARPSDLANSAVIARVSSDSTQILAVQDLRKTSCAGGPFSAISDAAGEETLAGIFGNYGFKSGLQLVSGDTTSSVKILPGASYINGEYRGISSELNVSGATTANTVTGVSGLDAGSLGANTTYYLYGTADNSGENDLVGVLSTSATAPSGATNYRRLGESNTNASSVFSASSDTTTVFYTGAVVQTKKFETSSAATGTTIIPYDDTIPQYSSDGDTYMTLKFTPTRATNKLKIDVSWHGASSQVGEGQMTACLFQNTDANALACGVTFDTTNTAGTIHEINFPHWMIAGRTSEMTFTVKAGYHAAGTTTFNGAGGSRMLGGALVSSITITEYAG